MLKNLSKSNLYILAEEISSRMPGEIEGTIFPSSENVNDVLEFLYINNLLNLDKCESIVDRVVQLRQLE